MKKVKQSNIAIYLHHSVLLGKSTSLNLADNSVEDIWQTLNTEIANEEQEVKEQRCGFVIVDNATNDALACEDFGESEPAFSLGAAIAALRWLNEGWGYEVTGMDVVEAYDLALAAGDLSQAPGLISALKLERESL